MSKWMVTFGLLLAGPAPALSQEPSFDDIAYIARAAAPSGPVRAPLDAEDCERHFRSRRVRDTMQPSRRERARAECLLQAESRARLEQLASNAVVDAPQ